MLTHLDETQAMLRDAARGFCVEQEGRRAAPRQALWTALAGMGWTGVTLPAALGGSESTPVEAGVIAFEMGRRALFTSYPETVALGTVLAEADTRNAATDALLEHVAVGEAELLMGQREALSPGASSEAGGASGPLIDGRIVLPGGAAQAFVAVFRDQGQPLLLMVPLRALPGTDLKTTARTAAIAVSERGFEPDPAWIVLKGAAAAHAWHRARQIVNALYCAELVGATRRLHEIAFDYAMIRSQFGHLIATYQAVQHALVDTFAAAEAAELLTFRALNVLASGDAAEPVVHPAVAFVREAAWTTLMKAYDILGGVGFIEEHPISLYTRGMVPIVTFLGSAQSCNEAVADTVRKGHWF